MNNKKWKMNRDIISFIFKAIVTSCFKWCSVMHAAWHKHHFNKRKTRNFAYILVLSCAWDNNNQITYFKVTATVHGHHHLLFCCVACNQHSALHLSHVHCTLHNYIVHKNNFGSGIQSRSYLLFTFRTYNTNIIKNENNSEGQCGTSARISFSTTFSIDLRR